MFRFDFTEFEFCIPSKPRSGFFGGFLAVGRGRLVRLRIKLNVEKCNDTHRDKVFTHPGPQKELKLLIQTRQ